MDCSSFLFEKITTQKRRELDRHTMVLRAMGREKKKKRDQLEKLLEAVIRGALRHQENFICTSELLC